MLLKNVRLSFPKIWRPEAFQADQKKKYGAGFILPKSHPQLDELRAEIAAQCEQSWGKDWKKTFKNLAEDKQGLRDGSVKADKDGYSGEVLFFNASTDKRPGVYDRDQSPLVEEDGRPYAGCYVNALIDVWAQDNKFGKRVNFSLRGVQFVEDGDAFAGGGSPAAADDFPDMSDGVPAAADASGEDTGSWLD